MRKRDLLCFGFGDLIRARSAGWIGLCGLIRAGSRCFACAGLLQRVAVRFEDRAVGSLDLVVVFISAGRELHFVNRDAVFGIIVCGKIADILGAQSGVV